MKGAYYGAQGFASMACTAAIGGGEPFQEFE